MVGIKAGVVTPTEAAAMAVAYTMFLCFVVYREITIKDFFGILVTGAKNTSIIMFLIASAMISAWMIAVANVPVVIGGWLEPLVDQPVVLMVAINIMVFIVGTAMDLTPTVLILTPMLMPIIAKAGIDPVYFGVVFILNNAIGLITPPVGTVLNAACGASKVSMDDIMGKIMPFLIVETVMLVLMMLIPELITVPFHWITGGK
jgi:tripartite ATP-independent transporter DctM subunit